MLKGSHLAYKISRRPGYHWPVKLTAHHIASVAPRAAQIAASLPEHAEGEVLLKLKPQVSVDDYLGTRLLEGAEMVEHFQIPSAMKAAFGGELLRLKLPPGVSAAEGIALFEGDQSLAYVTSNDKRYATQQPNDEKHSELWGLQTIQAEKAWDRTTGSRSGPIIAVLDTGIDASHPDLAPNLWINPGEIPSNGIDDDGNGVIDDVHGYNATDGSGNPFDDIGHGTHCAGTIGAVGNNQEGVAGVNWQARLMPVKMMVDGQGTVADTVRALLYATANGATITSNSYGGPYSQPEYEAFAASPLLHICAAGNEGNDNDVSRYYPSDRPIGYPASFELPNVISVAATSSRDRLAGFSNYGAQTVDLAAPGVGILSTVPGGGYETKSGTSMATPHVAGVAGLIATLYPEAGPDEIKTRLLANVDELPSLKGKVLTGGRLNAARALEDDTLPPSTPPASLQSATPTSARLAWTNGFDDGKHGGGATTFTEIRWSEADGRPGLVRLPSGPPGSVSRHEVALFPSGQARSVSFEIVHIDNAANESAPAQLEAAIPAARLNPVEWQTDGLWSRIDLPGRPDVWTDSADGNYQHKADSSLTSKPLTLHGSGNVLQFETRYRIEPQDDGVELEVREAGTEKWTRLESYSSYREWKKETVDLSAYDGKTVQLRFRLHSNSVKNEEGIYLDRLVVAAQPDSFSPF